MAWMARLWLAARANYVLLTGPYVPLIRQLRAAFHVMSDSLHGTVAGRRGWQGRWGDEGGPNGIDDMDIWGWENVAYRAGEKMNFKKVLLLKFYEKFIQNAVQIFYVMTFLFPLFLSIIHLSFC